MAPFLTWGDRTPATLAALCGVLLCVASTGCDPASTGSADRSSPDGEVVSLIGDRLPADATLREALRHPDPLERLQRVAQILQRSGPEDLDDVTYEFENAALEWGDYEYGLFGNWWARFDPVAAYVYADNHLRTEKPSVILQVVRAWAYADPVGAVESKMLNSFGTGVAAMRDDLTDAFVTGWFQGVEQNGGEDALITWIVTQPDNSGVQRGLKAFARMRILRDGEQETLDWIKTEPYEPAVNRLLLAGALSVISHHNPQLAVSWLPIAEKDGVDIRTFIPRIARSWAHHEPRAAVEWVLTNPESSERTTALSAVGRRWMRKDPSGLAEWLTTIENEPWSDPLRNVSTRQYVVNSRFQVDWPSVIDGAKAMTDEGQRTGLISWILRRWFVVDEEAAEKWVAENPGVVSEVTVARARKITPGERARIENAASGGT